MNTPAIDREAPESVSAGAQSTAEALTPTELNDLRDTIRAFLARTVTQEVVRAAMASDTFDRSLWTALETEVGMLGVLGDRAALPALGVLAEELGRVVYPGPFLGGAAAAAQACLHHPDAARGIELLEQLRTGELIAATCLDRRAVDGLRLTPRAEGWTVTGSVAAVVDAPIADIAVLATTLDGDDQVIVAVDLRGGDAEVTPLPSIDQTRRQGNLEFRGAPAEILVTAERSATFIQAADAQARALLAAENLGGADVVLAMAVDYAKTRIQFGRAIGSFQAIKHRCTDMYVKVQGTRSLSEAAIELASRPETELDPHILAAHSYCAESYLAVAEANIQIHGGIGFTWEHPAHLYLKRARGSQVLLGSPLAARASMMERLREMRAS